MLPAAPAMAAWALVTGVAMAKSPLGLFRATGFSLIAFAGAAQLATLPLLVAGAPVAVSVVTALMVNLRFVIYSAALRPSLGSLPLRWRFLLGYFVSDLAFVLYLREESHWRSSPLRGWYFLGLGLGVATAWHVASLVGLYAATAIPETWGIDFVGTLALLALLVPMLTNVPVIAGASTSALLAVALREMPFRLGLIVAIAAGIVTAMVAERLPLRTRHLP